MMAVLVVVPKTTDFDYHPKIHFSNTAESGPSGLLISVLSATAVISQIDADPSHAFLQTIFQAHTTLTTVPELEETGGLMTRKIVGQDRSMPLSEESGPRGARLLTRPFDARKRIMEFSSGASTEITTHDAHLIPDLAKTLRPGTTVYVAHTPKAKLEDVVRVSIELQLRGLSASPHIVARRLVSERMLREAIGTLRKAGIDQILVVAGDVDIPAGPFASSLDVIDSGALCDAQLRSVAFAGHPEGHHAMDAGQLMDALRRKQDFALRTGIDVHVTTQFGFNAETVYRWVRELSVQGVNLPVHVGIAGPTSTHKLLKFALKCGVGASLQAALRNPGSIGNMVAMTTPEAMIMELVGLGAGSELAQIVKPHFFTFGGALACAKWFRSVADGAFELLRDGTLRLTHR